MSSESIKTFDTSPILKMPEDVTPEIKDFLKTKEREYGEELSKQVGEGNPSDKRYFDLRYKTSILRELNERGSVDLDALALELEKSEGGAFNEWAFQDAYLTIESHMRTGQ